MPSHTRSTRSRTETAMTLVLEDLNSSWRGDNPNWVHKCQNGKIVHTHFGLAPERRLLRFAHVVCEPRGPMSITPMSYMAHWSMSPACTRWLNMVHGGQKMWEIAQNGRKCAHSWLGKLGTCPTWTGVCHRIGIKSYASNISFGRRPTPPILGMAGSPREPMI